MIANRAPRADQTVLRNQGHELLTARSASDDASRRRRLPRRLFRGIVHALSHRFILRRRSTTQSHAAGFRLVVPPTVFPPRIFLTSEFFAAFIDRLDLAGLRVADVGTGSGILALAAARAGAASVTAIDINPNAAHAAHQNAQRNGFGDVLRGVCSHLMSGLAARPLFDVILSSPPSFSGEPLDLADRAWHSGADNRHIAALFEQARERLHPRGRMYLLLSSDSDLSQIGALIARQSFQVRCVAARSIFFEAFFVYELTRPDRHPKFVSG